VVRQQRAAAEAGPHHRPTPGGQDVSSGPEPAGCDGLAVAAAGAAGTAERPAAGKDLCPPGGERSEWPVAATNATAQPYHHRMPGVAQGGVLRWSTG